MQKFVPHNPIGNQHGNACERDTASNLGTGRLSREVAGSGQIKDGSRHRAHHPAESSRNSHAHSLARTIPECAARTFCFPVRKVRPCWKRPQFVQLCNRPLKANATLEGWMGERSQGCDGLLPLSRSPPHFHFKASRISSFGLDGHGTGGACIPRHDGKIQPYPHGSETQGG